VKKHEPVPRGFHSYAEKYDEQAEPGAFMTECWPVIKEFGDKKWLDQPEDVKEAKLMRIVDSSDTADVSNINWSVFREQTGKLVACQKKHNPGKY